MNTVYSDVVFSNRQPDQVTATKLNLLRDDLSSAIASIGGYYSDIWKWTNNISVISSGQVAVNTLSWTTATTLYVSEFSASGEDKTIAMNRTLVSGNNVTVRDAANSGNYAEYTITAAGTDHGTYRTYPIAVTTSAGALPQNNADTVLEVYVQGATGGGGGGGDMLKSVYDTNADNIVDHAALADAAPWTGITGRPSTFPPDSTAMLKSVYDTNNNNIVDQAEAANSVPWTGVTGKPTAFTPATHGTTHLDNGTDVIPVVTTSRTGLAPTLNGNAVTYLNGNGAFSTPSGVTPSAHASTHITGGSDVIPAPTSAATGLVPVLPATLASAKFLRGDATFAQPDYGNLTGVPGSFTPAAHKATHQSGGSDAIPLDTLAATTDITTLNASATAHGLLPKLANTTTKFLRDDGTWQTIAGGGDMLKSTYDTNANGKVDTCDTAPLHASTHITGGTDVIASVVAAASGLVPSPASVAFAMLSTDTSGNPAWNDLVGQVFGMFAQDLVFDDFTNRVDATTTSGTQVDWHYGWTTSLVGTGAQVNSSSSVGVETFNKAWGTMVVTTGTTATGRSQVFIPNGFRAGLGALDLYFRVAISALPTSTDKVIYYWGLQSTSGGALTTPNGIFLNLQYDATSAAPRWFGSVSDGTEVDTAMAASPAIVAYSASALSFYNVRISINAAWTSVSFFVNNVQIGAALTTHIPLTSILTPTLSVLKTTGTTSMSGYTDKLFMRYQRGAM